MPVLIIGATSDLGRRLASLLLEQDAQVRVYVEEDDPEFRAAGCKVAIGELDDIGRIESAMEQVHTVVHLAGHAEPAPGRDLEWQIEETTEVAVRAAESADVVRFLAISELGADPADRNVYLRSRGRADEMILKGSLQTCVLRCAPMLGPGAPLARVLRRGLSGRAPVAPGDGTQRLNPVWVGDVAQALLDADSREAEISGLIAIGGPEVVTFDELVERATGRARIAHRRSVPGLPGHLADAYRRDCVADLALFRDHFGRVPSTSLEEALQASIPI